MMANPFQSQLGGFTAGVPNARRGLVALYRTRARGRERTGRTLRSLYGNATASQNASTQRGLAGVATGVGAGYGLVQSSGYDVDPAQVAQLRGLVQQGGAPFNTLIAGQGGAVAQELRGFGRYAVGEQRGLAAALPRERSAALSELEQGIVATQTGLAAQAADFASQQSFVGQQARYYNQLTQQAGLQTGQPAMGASSPNAAENWIIQHESSGDVNADNPRSTAFGLGQLLYDNRVKYGRILGVDPNTRDYNAQLAMMRLYIKDRYKTAQAAMAFWQANGWYAMAPLGLFEGPLWLRLMSSILVVILTLLGRNRHGLAEAAAHASRNDPLWAPQGSASRRGLPTLTAQAWRLVQAGIQRSLPWRRHAPEGEPQCTVQAKLWDHA